MTSAAPAGRRTTRCVDVVFALLVSFTLLAFVLGASSGAQGLSRTATVGVLATAALKVRLVLRHFMEVRHGPRWLRVGCDVWLAASCGGMAAAYLLTA